MAARTSKRVVLDASAVIRIMEGATQAGAFTNAVVNADLVLGACCA